jgi:DNA helicase II / ATP-dependent DNA helicase PcrA
MSYAVARTPGARATRRPSRFLDGTASVLGEAARSQPKRSRKGGAAGGKAAAPVRTTCRTCGADLGTAKERTIGRCSACPPTMDERLFEALREWRLETARAADVPAFVVFTDATLTAIAEKVPADVGALARINGVGPAKLERYGTDVLDLLKNFSGTETG